MSGRPSDYYPLDLLASNACDITLWSNRMEEDYSDVGQ